MVNWTDIHRNFDKYCQKYWEKQNLTYQDAQEWIKVGLTPYDYDFISQLKQNNFTPEQYANYKENKITQEQLDYFYANKDQVKIIKLNELNFNQPSELIINYYPNLKEINGHRIPNLSQLTINNCPQLETINVQYSENFQQLILNNLPELKKLDCCGNNLTNPEINNCANLERIDCYENNLNQDLSFLSGLVNLKELDLNNNPLYGSLESLKGMSKLETLSIYDTDIDSGLEYLPESVERLECSAYREDAKVKAIYNLFADEKGWVETDRYGKIEDLSQKLQEYKQKKQQQAKEQNQQKQIKPTLKHLLGKGGYGEVYYGKWKLQDVAVKKLYLSLPNISQADLKNINKEIDILKKLKNRHIIQYYDNYSDNQEILIIMEYAENGTLTKFINDNQDKNHDWSFNTNLIKQMAQGLAYIHHENIIHRDLKSLNILLTNNNQVKIADFGLSRAKIISSSQSKNNTTGTLRWMAPESIREQKYSEHSDIYALGMIIWELAAKCTTPFKEFDNNSVMFKIVFNNEKEVIPTDVPQNIQDIIKGCWKDNPSERITLENILENKLDGQVIHSSSFDYSDQSQNSQKINKQSSSLIDSGLNDFQIPSGEFSQLNLSENQLAEKESNQSTKQLIEENIEKIQVNIKLVDSPLYLKGNLICDNVVSALIGSTFGENTNLSHHKYATTIEEFEAQIQQAETYGIPGSSKKN